MSAATRHAGPLRDRRPGARGAIALLGATALVFGLSACGGGLSGENVVAVNGTPITTSTVNHWVMIAASASAGASGEAAQSVVPDPPTYTKCIAHLQATAPKPAKGQAPPSEATLKSECEQRYTSLKQEVVGYLISANWVIGEAEHLGVNLSDAEVHKQFNQIRSQQFPTEEAFKKFLQSSGYSVSDLLLRVKLPLLETKIEQKVSKGAGKKPSEKEVQSYYEQHKSQYGRPESRDLDLILTKTQAQAEKAKQEITSGKSFASVAKKRSIDPSAKSTGGSLPGVVKGQEQKALDEAVFKAQPNVLGGPIKTPFGYYIYEVKAVHAASQQPLSAVKTSIEQQLTQQSKQSVLSEFIKNFRKKWEARTECASGYMVQSCKGYKAPKTPIVPGATGAAAPQTSTPNTVTVKATPQSPTTKKK